jgi:hypothetical protein
VLGSGRISAAPAMHCLDAWRTINPDKDDS